MKNKSRNLRAEVTSTAIAAATLGQSLNREQRRAIGKGGSAADHLIQPPENNTVWDDLNRTAYSCGQLLAAPGVLLPMLNNAALMAKVDNMPHLERTASVLARDLQGFAKFYSGIQAQHAGMTGASSTPDEHLKAIMLHNDYLVWTEQFEANVRPMIESVAEIISTAEAKLNEEAPEEIQKLSQEVTTHIATHLNINVVAEEPGMTPEQDPNVITDVEVKEAVH